MATQGLKLITTIEGSEVSVWIADGGDSFRVTWPGGQRLLTGYKHALVVAHEVARELAKDS
jgi:hypothetical protein